MEVGPGVFSVAPGDHVVFGFVPACGRCPSCASGHSNLCDLGAARRDRPADLRRHESSPCPGSGPAARHRPARHVRPPHRRQRGELHQDRQGDPSRSRLSDGLRRRHRMGLGCLRRRRRARRHGRGRRHRRHRCQCGPGCTARRSAGHRGDRSGRVQAGEGDGVRRHTHARIDRRGARRDVGDDVGSWLRQGDHDDGCRQRRRPRPGLLVGRQAQQDRRHQHPPHSPRRRSPYRRCSSPSSRSS